MRRLFGGGGLLEIRVCFIGTGHFCVMVMDEVKCTENAKKKMKKKMKMKMKMKFREFVVSFCVRSDE